MTHPSRADRLVLTRARPARRRRTNADVLKTPNTIG